MSETRQVIFTKTDTPRNASAPWRLYDQANTEYAVWNQAMWDLVRMQHMNQPLTVEVESKPSKDGRFMNTSLLSFASNGVAPAPMAATPVAPAPAWPTTAQPVSVAPSASQTPVDVDHRIAKAVALKAAIDLYPHLDPKPANPGDLTLLADLFVPWLET